MDRQPDAAWQAYVSLYLHAVGNVARAAASRELGSARQVASVGWDADATDPEFVLESISVVALAR